MRTISPTSFVAALALLAPLAGGVAGADVPKDVFDKQRLEMLGRDDKGQVIAIFRRYPGRALPFIDGYLEGGLAILEKDPLRDQDALRSFRTGIAFAQLADEAFGGTTFSRYANAFASWSPSEQKSFREGQRLFREGMKGLKENPEGAIEPLERSLSLAEQLGDTWGQAMAHGALAKAYRKRGGDGATSRAGDAARAAADLNEALRLSDDQIEALLVVSELEARPLRVTETLGKAWAVASSDPSVGAELRTTVAERLATELERLGDPSQAARLRDEARRKNEASAGASSSAPETPAAAPKD